MSSVIHPPHHYKDGILLPPHMIPPPPIAVTPPPPVAPPPPIPVVAPPPPMAVAPPPPPPPPPVAPPPPIPVVAPPPVAPPPPIPVVAPPPIISPPQPLVSPPPPPPAPPIISPPQPLVISPPQQLVSNVTPVIGVPPVVPKVDYNNLGVVPPNTVDQYITVMTMNSENGKLYFLDEHAKVQKQSIANSGQGELTTHHVPTVDRFKEVLDSIADKTNCAIILGYVKTTEPETGQNVGEPFRVITKKEMRERFKLRGKVVKPVLDKRDGKRYVTREKTAFTSSTWMCFDLDTDEYTPPALLQTIANKTYHGCLADMMPELANVDYLSVPSSSNRITVNGVSPYPANEHIYMQGNQPSDSL